MTKPKDPKPPKEEKFVGPAIVREAEALVKAGLATKTTYDASKPVSMKKLLASMTQCACCGNLKADVCAVCGN